MKNDNLGAAKRISPHFRGRWLSGGKLKAATKQHRQHIVVAQLVSDVLGWHSCVQQHATARTQVNVRLMGHQEFQFLQPEQRHSFAAVRDTLKNGDLTPIHHRP
jgi:hypothetical protein